MASPDGEMASPGREMAARRREMNARRREMNARRREIDAPRPEIHAVCEARSAEERASDAGPCEMISRCAETKASSVEKKACRGDKTLLKILFNLRNPWPLCLPKHNPPRFLASPSFPLPGTNTVKPKPKTPMTQDQDNVTTMFDTALTFLDTNNSVWSATPAFADAVTRAKTGVDEINQTADAQQTPTSGVTDDKADIRADLEERTLEIADQLSALAVKNGDNDLGAKVEMTKSSLDKLTDTDLEQTAERVAGLATDNIAALAAYDVVAADVTALTTARTTFLGIKTSPRQATVGRKTQTDSFPQRIAKVRSIFRNEIDKMVTKKKRANPGFYAGYFNARIIVNRAATIPKPPKPPTPPKPNP